MAVVVNTSIPISLEKIQHFDAEDTRYTKVRIHLMHLGENLNGSYFSKESVEKALPTLANTPILGYIEDNKDGEEDFSNHRSEIVREDGKWGSIYKGSVYGVIPETNNARFEFKMCDDDVEREFLVVDGLMWNKIADAVDILERCGEKAQSMELHSDFTGKYNKKDKLFHFSEFSFNGACLLGVDYKPAMRGASVEVYEAPDQGFAAIVQEINDKVNIFHAFQSQNGSGVLIDSTSLEGGENMANNNPQTIVTEIPKTAPVVVVPDPVVTETPIAYNFGLTNSQLSTELAKALNPNPTTDEWGWMVYDYYYVDADTENGVVVAYDAKTFELVGLSYSMNGDFPAIDFASKKRFKANYGPMEGGDPAAFALRSVAHAKYMSEVVAKQTEKTFTEAQTKAQVVLKTQIDTLTAENTELKEFKATTLVDSRKADEDDLFNQFAEQLSAEEIATVREKAADFSVDELKMQLFALVGMKTAKFTANTKPNTALRIPIEDPNRTPEATKSNKPYAHLIEEVNASKNQ